MTLVCLDPDRCPNCGTTVELVRWDQPAIVRHAGHGGTTTTTVAYCPTCPWSLRTLVETTAPCTLDIELTSLLDVPGLDTEEANDE